MSFSIIDFKKLTDNKKKFSITLKNNETNRIKTIKFGAYGYQHYTEGHLDENRKRLYYLRHNKNENYNKIDSAGFWSYWLLWKFKTYKEALDYIFNTFDIK
jgi:hypothetical protein